METNTTLFHIISAALISSWNAHCYCKVQKGVVISNSHSHVKGWCLQPPINYSCVTLSYQPLKQSFFAAWGGLRLSLTRFPHPKAILTTFGSGRRHLLYLRVTGGLGSSLFHWVLTPPHPSFCCPTLLSPSQQQSQPTSKLQPICQLPANLPTFKLTSLVNYEVSSLCTLLIFKPTNEFPA